MVSRGKPHTRTNNNTINMGYYISGSNEVDYSQLQTLPTPRGMTPTHYPVAHDTIIDLVTNKVQDIGYTIDEARYGIDQHGDMFGYMKLMRESERNGVFNNVIGIRNSHMQRFAAALAAGSNVMVCDNLAFHGECEIGHKHTKNIMDKLPGRIDALIQQIQDNFKAQADRYDQYQECSITDNDAHRILGHAIERGAISPSKSGLVLKEYRSPRHDEFSPRTAWSYFNAFTEILKTTPRQLQERSIKLHSVFDEHVELQYKPTKIQPEELSNLLELPF